MFLPLLHRVDSNSAADGKGGAIYTRKSTAVVGSYFQSNSVSGLRPVSGGDVYIQSGNFSTSDCETGNGANGTFGVGYRERAHVDLIWADLKVGL